MVEVHSTAPVRRKCVVVILDGLGDLPVDTLGGQTPLEAAETPFFNRLAGSGRYGLVDPVAPGVIPNTHSGVGLMFGLRPEQKNLLRRGPVEAAGAGLALNPGDVAFRANFATLEEREGRLFVSERRAGRVTHDSAQFAAVLKDIDLGDGVSARFQPTDQHRGVLRLRGDGLEGHLSDTDPGDRKAPGWLNSCRALDSASSFAADKANRFILEAHDRLKAHPLNRVREAAGKFPVTGVITRGAGGWLRLDRVLDERKINAALVTGCNTVAGLGQMFGMHVIREPAFTADANTDVRGKLAAARDALAGYPLVYVHIKATDLFSHDFQPRGKRDFIERVDRAMEIFDDSGAALALTADHTTNSNTGAHSAEPVPVFFHDPAQAVARQGASVEFGESACRKGPLGRRNGHEFLLEIADYLAS